MKWQAKVTKSGGAERRDGRDELLAVEVDVVFVQLHLGEDLVLEDGHQLVGHHVVKARMLLGLGHHAAQPALAAVVVALHALVGGAGQDGQARDEGRVDVLVDERELLHQLPDQAVVHVVQRVGHVVVTLLAEELLLAGRVVVLVGNDVAYQVYGRVVLAAVMLALGLDHHLAQLHVLRHEAHGDRHLAAAGRDELGVVAQVAELHLAARLHHHLEAAVQVGDRAVGRALLGDVHKVDGLLSEAVDHLSLQGDARLSRRAGGQQGQRHGEQ